LVTAKTKRAPQVRKLMKFLKYSFGNFYFVT
jgi:hypothetical protein